MTDLPKLETTRLRLRPYREDDLPELLPLIGTREVAATTLRIAHPYTEQDARDFLALGREPGKIWLAITLRSDGRQIGGIGLRVDAQLLAGPSVLGSGLCDGSSGRDGSLWI
ncbi:MAG: GNAT family N-acetyltransferase [Candidatus Sulfotelmatobacter sp.]